MRATSNKPREPDASEKNQRTRQSLAAIDNGQVFEDDEVADFLDSLDTENPLPLPYKMKSPPER
jgi:hypothetical protein